MPTMPEAACLHVQARTEDSVRVVDLRGGSVRIGRAAYCDVRLPEPDLPDEACRLRRQRGEWFLFPLRSTGPVSIDGGPVAQPCPIAFGASFRVGEFTLTLQPAGSAPESWGDNNLPRVTTVGPSGPSPIRHEPNWPDDFSQPAFEPSTAPQVLAPVANLRSEWPSQEEGHDRWIQARNETKRWESRWRAVGESLKANAERPAAPSTSSVAMKSARTRTVSPPTVERRPSSVHMPTRPSVAFGSEAPSVAVPVARNRPKAVPSRTPLSAYKATAPERPKRVSVPDSARTVERPASRPHTRPAPEVPRAPVPLTPLEPVARTIEPTCEVEATAPVIPPEVRGLVEATSAASLVAVDLDAPERIDDLTETVVEAAPLVAEAAEAICTEAPSDRWDDLDDEERYDEQEVAAPRRLGAVRRVPKEEVLEAEFESVVAVVEAPAAASEVLDEAVTEEPPTVPAQEKQSRWLRFWSQPAKPPELPEAPEPAPADTETVEEEPVPREDARETVEDESGWDFQDPFVAATTFGASPPWGQPSPNVVVTGTAAEAASFGIRGSGGPTARPNGRGNARRGGLGASGFESITTDPIDLEGASNGSRQSARDWPTVADIFAAQGGCSRERGGARTDRRKRAGSSTKGRSTPVRPEPTVSRQPGQWGLPFWLSWLPTSAVMIGVGAAGCLAGWTWARDGYNAGIIAGRLGQAETRAKPLPEGVGPGRTAWWATTATHLIEWAAYLDRNATDKEQAAEARALIDRAVEASPLQPTARFALAHPLPGETATLPLSRALGQSRDVAALAWSGRQLLAAGKKEAAFKAYKAALEMAANTDLTRPVSPTFLDDPETRRYVLPTEDQIGSVVRDMADQAAWTYADWSGAVPNGTAAPVVVARVLRERASADAERALDVAMRETDRIPEGNGPEAAVLLAAQGEAFAMKGRWGDAEERYREAIKRMPVDVVRRSWWMNLADIALRLGEESKRLEALDLAKSSDTKDEITVRAVELQKATGFDGQRAAVRTARAPDPRR